MPEKFSPHPRSPRLLTMVTLGLGLLTACTPPKVLVHRPVLREGLRPEPNDPPSAIARTSEPQGLRVLYHGGWAPGLRFTAQNKEELEVLWAGIRSLDPPRVDFHSHVVFAFAYSGGTCLREIVSLSLHADKTLVLESLPLQELCVGCGSTNTLVLAVPRTLLHAGPTRLWFEHELREFEGFDVTDVRPVTEGDAQPQDTAGTEESPSAVPQCEGSPLGEIAVPQVGHLALEALSDGTELWVAHHRDGSLSVLESTVPDDGRAQTLQAVYWLPRWQRFSSGRDVRGRSVLGHDQARAFRYVLAPDGARAQVCALGKLPEGPVVARSEAYVLDGPAMPYASVPTITLSSEPIPDNQYVRVQSSLVAGSSGPPSFCDVPTEPKLWDYWQGCPAGAPTPPGARAESRHGVTYAEGPFVLRRHGAQLDFAMHVGSLGGGFRAEYVVQPPAARGPTRTKSTLQLGHIARGNTRGALDGFEPACTLLGGAPDERWSFTATEQGSYAFQLVSDFDGALVVLDQNNTVLACNDDQNGTYRSSIAHAELAAGQSVGVLVDGFGGASGAYRLEVHREPALDQGGVLTLSQPVHGDTTEASNDYGPGYIAWANDDRYDFVPTEDGEYEFEITTPGWKPVLSVFGPSNERTPLTIAWGPAPTPPLRHRVRLSPGYFYIVVDGREARDHGPYTLRVRQVRPPS